MQISAKWPTTQTNPSYVSLCSVSYWIFIEFYSQQCPKGNPKDKVQDLLSVNQKQTNL